jgi:hypothetical protein
VIVELHPRLKKDLASVAEKVQIFSDDATQKEKAAADALLVRLQHIIEGQEVGVAALALFSLLVNLAERTDRKVAAQANGPVN